MQTHKKSFISCQKFQTALSQVYRLKNVKEILPKLNSCIQEAMNDLNSFSKTGEEVLFEENVIDPCLLTAVARAVCGVEITSIKDQRQVNPDKPGGKISTTSKTTISVLSFRKW